MNYSRFPCCKPTHESSLLQYICTNQKCLKSSNFIGCIHCGKDEHREHLDRVMAIKVFINQVANGDSQTGQGIERLKEKRQEVLGVLKNIDDEIGRIQKKAQSDEEGNHREVLLSNLHICKTEEAFRQNLFELVELSSVTPDQKLFNEEMARLRKFADNFQANRVKAVQPPKKDHSQSKLIHQDQQLIKPIFTFRQSQQYKLIGPYSIRSTRTGFTNILAYPSLNTFRQSVEFSFIIKRVQPDWLAVGVSRNKGNFSLTEKGFFLWVSNGWMLTNGKQQQSNVRFTVNDKITVKFDKAKSLLILFKNGKEHEPKLIELEDELWNELYPCVVFYNQGDVVDILQ